MIASSGASARLNWTPTIPIGASDNSAPSAVTRAPMPCARPVASAIRRARCFVDRRHDAIGQQNGRSDQRCTDHPTPRDPATLSIDQFASSHIDTGAADPTVIATFDNRISVATRG